VVGLNVRFLIFGLAFLSFLAAMRVEARGQSPISNVYLAPDQIATVRLALGITTRISFPEPVREIICGDLYDASSGKGTFVVQRSDEDIYLKPVSSKGTTNLFVKTGATGEHVYNFDLTVVTMQQAHRVVYVRGPANQGASNAGGADRRSESPATPQPRTLIPVNTEEILRAARDQAAQLIADAEKSSIEAERASNERIKKQLDDRFVQTLLTGLRQIRLNTAGLSNKRFAITLDQSLLILNEHAYLRFTIQNIGSTDLAYSAITLETISENINRSVSVEVVQSNKENTIKPNEMITCILIFDASSVGPRDRLTLNVRGAGNSEIARVRIQQ
jgi:hypothetical protein